MGADKHQKYKPPGQKKRHGEIKEMFAKPEAPAPTAEEIALQQRQREALAQLDDQENTRLKRGMRGQLGSRRLLSSVRNTAAPRASTSGGGAPRVISPSRSGGSRSTRVA